MARFIYNSRDLGELFLEAVNKKKTQISVTPPPHFPHLRVKNKQTIVSQLPSKRNSQVCIMTPFLPDKKNSPTISRVSMASMVFVIVVYRGMCGTREKCAATTCSVKKAQQKKEKMEVRENVKGAKRKRKEPSKNPFD